MNINIQIYYCLNIYKYRNIIAIKTSNSLFYFWYLANDWIFHLRKLITNQSVLLDLQQLSNSK